MEEVNMKVNKDHIINLLDKKVKKSNITGYSKKVVIREEKVVNTSKITKNMCNSMKEEEATVDSPKNYIMEENIKEVKDMVEEKENKEEHMVKKAKVEKEKATRAKEMKKVKKMKDITKHFLLRLLTSRLNQDQTILNSYYSQLYSWQSLLVYGISTIRERRLVAPAKLIKKMYPTTHFSNIE